MFARATLVLALVLFNVALVPTRGQVVGESVVLRGGPAPRAEAPAGLDEDGRTAGRSRGRDASPVRVYRLAESRGQWSRVESDESAPGGWVETKRLVPLSRAEQDFTRFTQAFPDDPVGAAIRELLDLGLLRALSDERYELHETVRAGLERLCAPSARRRWWCTVAWPPMFSLTNRTRSGLCARSVPLIPSAAESCLLRGINQA